MTGITSRLTAALFNRYAIEREIGSGGMATVYLAEDLKHKRKVAVKVLRPLLTPLHPGASTRDPVSRPQEVASGYGD
jgi:serine/threonine-protein kinase